MTQTVLVVGSTGNIGVSAVIAARNTGYKVLAIVRNKDSAKKLITHVGSGEGITVVEADITSSSGVQGIVDRVTAGELPAFQHVYATAGGQIAQTKLHEISDEEWRHTMTLNLDANFYAYRATVPYLLSQNDPSSTWTVSTGAAGRFGLWAGPAISQGALYSLAASAIRELAGTNIRFNEAYIATRVEVDSRAIQNGVMKSSDYAKIYEGILKDSSIRDSKVTVQDPEDVKHMKIEKNELALFKIG